MRSRAPTPALAMRLVASLALVPSLARAAPPAPAPAPDPGEARAEARFRDGSDAFDHGRTDEACIAFAESLRLYPTLGTLLNLALCHEKQGKTATAWSEFTGAAAWATDPAQRERRDFARQHAGRLEKGLARVRLELPEGATAVDVAVDGDSISESRRSLPLLLDPGEHAVTASAPSFKTYAARFTIPVTAPADPIVVKIPALEAAPPPPPLAAPPPPPPPPPPLRTVGLVVGGVGIVALGVGTVFGADAISRSGGSDTGAAQTSEAVSLATLLVGAVAVGAGAWLVFAPSPLGSRKGAGVAVVPLLRRGGGGMTIAGAF